MMGMKKIKQTNLKLIEGGFSGVVPFIRAFFCCSSLSINSFSCGELSKKLSSFMKLPCVIHEKSNDVLPGMAVLAGMFTDASDARRVKSSDKNREKRRNQARSNKSIRTVWIA
jgi:hypothetical protein